MNIGSKVASFIARLLSLLTTACILLLVVNYLVSTIDFMPGYAAVYLDDENKTYLAPGCVQEWQSRKENTITFIRLGVAAEAFSEHYKPDDACKEDGWFAQDGAGIVRSYAIRWGWLPPVHHWWDDPYRKEDGTIVYPNGKAP